MKNIEYLIEILSKKLAETSKNDEKVQNENKKIEEVLNDLECTYDSIKKYTSDIELRKILEKKSKCNIRTDIFDKYIADIQEQSEKINNYIIGLK